MRATIRPLLTVRNEREYDQAIKPLHSLLDEIGTNERHPLYGLLDALGTLVHAYEEKHHALPESHGADMLRSPDSRAGEALSRIACGVHVGRRAFGLYWV